MILDLFKKKHHPDTKNEGAQSLFLQHFYHFAIARNPVLIQMLAICTVMAAGTLKLALMFTAAFAVIFLATQCLANLFMAGWKRYFRVAAYAAIGAIFSWAILLFIQGIDENFPVSSSIYLTMLAVSGITVLHCEKGAVNKPFKESLEEALVLILGYGLVISLCGAMREILATGQLFTWVIIPDFGISFFAHPMSSLFILGFLAAFLRVVVHQYLMPYVHEVAMKVSKTRVTIAEVPDSQQPPEYAPIDYESPAPNSTETDISGKTDTRGEFSHEDSAREDIPPADSEDSDTPYAPSPVLPEEAPPAAFEDTQERFETMLAELRKRYLE
ncbi:MAG: hypothetical protein FWG82_01670 [Oscillospiraceae bacterium]|nr:hypothetical protein [Oscillospiraceae bacterium]